MPKYMFTANYTHEGLKGLLKEGGSKRREAVKRALESLGGSMAHTTIPPASRSPVASDPPRRRYRQKGVPPP